MHTTKQLITAIIIVIAISGIASFFNLDPFMNAFIGAGPVYNVFRAAAVALLIVLLVTNPPRTLRVRALLAGGSAALLGLLAYQFSTYQLYLLDAFVFVELAIIFAIEALEPYEAKHQRGNLTFTRAR